MPILTHTEIRIFSESKFHQLAESIIGIAFEIHNHFGRLFDESVFKKILLTRCASAEIYPAEREVRISVVHETFCKNYFMDLLFGSGLMVEAKTVEKLMQRHIAQTLNYLFLTGMHHGLLLNFRPGKVEKYFVSTNYDTEQRRNLFVIDDEWICLNDESHRLRAKMMDLLTDWGGLLETSLYREALIHLLGGTSKCLQWIPVFDGEAEVGCHESFVIADDIGVAITSLHQNVQPMREHLNRFLSHTRLKYLQWINLNRQKVEFRTLAR